MQSVCDSATNTHLQFVSYIRGIPWSNENCQCDSIMQIGWSNVFIHYQPVSLLSVLSKVFKKIMYERIVAFLNANNILYKFQFGFRPKHSPYLALITLIDKLTAALGNGDYAIGVFFDFSKAFDTVNHSILLDKLHHYSIRGCAHSWFKSYLSNRQQFVTSNGVMSSKQRIKCGVPQ